MLRLRALTQALQRVPSAQGLPHAAPGGVARGPMAPHSATPCLFFLRGHCRRGDRCEYSHSLSGPDVQQHALPFADRHFTEASPSAGGAAPSSSSGDGGHVVRVMSYNVLADHLAHDHAGELYTSAPRYALEWAYRSELIVREVAQYAPHVVCLQEVDHFRQIRDALAPLGYEGVYTQRTGERRDGLATFWRRDAFTPVLRDSIQFSSLGLKDNVAQVTVLTHAAGASTHSQRRYSGSQVSDSSDEDSAIPGGTPRSRRRPGSGGSGSYREAEAAAGGGPAPALVVANIHVLFNPRRGDIKLAQVRTLLENVQAVGRKQGRGAPAVICGDFNSAASSPIYSFLAEGALPLLDHDRKRLSGQVEGQGKGWPAMRSSFLAELRRAQQGWQGAEQTPPQEHHPASEAAALDAAMSSYPPYNSLTDPHSSVADPRMLPGDRQPPYAPYSPEVGGSSGGRWGTPPSSGRQQRQWTADELALAMGAAAFTAAGGGTPEQQQQQQQKQRSKKGTAPPLPAALDEGACVAGHPLALRSAYADAAGHEPAYTTCHDKFIGTVDYIWFTPYGTGPAGARGGPRLAPLRVLQPPPLASLRTGLPSGAWPSDHISLLADFALAPS